MKKNDKYINSWLEFKSLAEKWKPIEGFNPYAFRGQSMKSWKLQTSLHRKLMELGISNQHEALEVEHQITVDFRNWSRKHLNSVEKRIKESDLLSWWELMQHYGAPTRLLDWSSSPYIACYFAVSENFDEDASIYLFDAGHLLWIQSLRANEEIIFVNKKGFTEIEKSIKGEDYKQYVLTIRDPKPTDRMRAQMAEFTLSTELLIEHNELADKIVFEKVINGEDQSIFQKYIIPSSLKKEFMRELNKLNINGETLFPGLDGVGRRLNESIVTRIIK